MSDHKICFRAIPIIGSFFALLISLFLQVPTASAIPSYARQTGFPCKSCHYMPPELTPLGRAFKLNGYTMTGKPTVTSPGKGNVSPLNILESFPLAVLFDTSFTSLKTPQPGAQNGSFEFPQQASLFLAGAWATHVGSFVQVTYNSQGDHFSWDNSDIRYANATKLFKKDLAFGITLNNNPTVEDLWNSTPAWGFPWVSSDWAPGPTASAIINGGLAQDVAGLGGYAMWDNHLYLAATAYRSAHLGVTLPNTGAGQSFNIRGVAPYWRVAWQQNSKNNNLMVGTYGMHMKSTPGAITGMEDSYTDWAADFQDDLTIPKFRGDVVSFRGTYIRENSALVATAGLMPPVAGFAPHHLNTVQANAEYHLGDKYSGTIGWFNVDGTPDPLLFNAGSLPPLPVTGSANGDPRSAGYIANISWWPVQNIGLTLQYTGYTRFNGAATNYDGAGRNADSNNALYLLARFVF
ncbi:MAG TPA: cytochrome C [Verrucomicrobiae bacterium]|nr:cytochrome C [Verrucomicrobiae bacterium]